MINQVINSHKGLEIKGLENLSSDKNSFTTKLYDTKKRL